MGCEIAICNVTRVIEKEWVFSFYRKNGQMTWIIESWFVTRPNTIRDAQNPSVALLKEILWSTANHVLTQYDKIQTKPTASFFLTFCPKYQLSREKRLHHIARANDATD
jgi:hypothetical protein